MSSHSTFYRCRALQSRLALWRVGVKNCGALEHRCERTTRADSAVTMATMLDHFWTHTHTYNAVILSAAWHSEALQSCCLRYERTPPDGSPFMCTRLVLAEGMECARFAVRRTFIPCVQLTNGWVEVGMPAKSMPPRGGSGRSSLQRHNAKNSSALEHRRTQAAHAAHASMMAMVPVAVGFLPAVTCRNGAKRASQPVRS